MARQRETMGRLLNNKATHYQDPLKEGVNLDNSSPAENLKLSKEDMCSLCERVYHLRNLVGVVPFKAVAKWREQHGCPFPPREKRLMTPNIYGASYLCTFCMQFFDDSFGDYIDYHRGKTDIPDRILLLEGNRQGSMLDPRITRILQQFAVEKKPGVMGRPTSGFELQLAMDRLRAKKGLPLRMGEVGSELARYSSLLDAAKAKDAMMHLHQNKKEKKVRHVSKRLYDSGKSLIDRRTMMGETFHQEFPGLPSKKRRISNGCGMSSLHMCHITIALP